MKESRCMMKVMASRFLVEGEGRGGEERGGEEMSVQFVGEDIQRNKIILSQVTISSHRVNNVSAGLKSRARSTLATLPTDRSS